MGISHFIACAAVSQGYFAWDLEAECYFATKSLIRKVGNVLVTHREKSTIWAELLFLKKKKKKRVAIKVEMGDLGWNIWQHANIQENIFRKMYDSSTEVTESHKVTATEVKRERVAVGEMGWVGGKKAKKER